MLLKLVPMLFCVLLCSEVEPPVLAWSLPLQHSCLLNEMQILDISSVNLLLCNLMREFQLCTFRKIQQQDTQSRNIHNTLLKAVPKGNVFSCILTFPVVYINILLVSMISFKNYRKISVSLLCVSS